MLAGEEVSGGFPGGLTVGGGGGATAGLPGRLKIHLCLCRCCGILMVQLVLHFNKPNMESRYAKKKGAKFHVPHSKTDNDFNSSSVILVFFINILKYFF